MVWRQNDRGREGDGDLDRFTARRSLAMGHVCGHRIDAVHDRVLDGEALGHETGAEHECSQLPVARGGLDLDIGGRVEPQRHAPRGGDGRVLGEHVIDLDFHVADTRQRSSRWDQPCNRRAGDARGLGQDEIVGGLGLERAGGGRLRQRTDEPVGGPGAEEERIRPDGRCQPRRGGHGGGYQQTFHTNLLLIVRLWPVRPGRLWG